jgi:hypothetical protein
MGVLWVFLWPKNSFVYFQKGLVYLNKWAHNVFQELGNKELLGGQPRIRG